MMAKGGDLGPKNFRRIRIGNWFGFTVGMLFLSLTAWLLADTVLFIARAERAEAVVTALNHDGKGRTAPSFRFTTPDGRTFVARDKLSGSSSRWALGERATVRYDPADPRRARPTSFLSTYFPLLISSWLTIGFLFFGLAPRKRTVKQ